MLRFWNFPLSRQLVEVSFRVVRWAPLKTVLLFGHNRVSHNFHSFMGKIWMLTFSPKVITSQSFRLSKPKKEHSIHSCLDNWFLPVPEEQSEFFLHRLTLHSQAKVDSTFLKFSFVYLQCSFLQIQSLQNSAQNLKIV